MNQAWKRTERAIARRLRGRRSGVLAQWGRPGVPDVCTRWLAIEVKERRQVPAWLRGAINKARSGATSEQLGIAVLHQAGRRHDKDVVLVRLADFQDWFGIPEADHGATV